VTLDVFLIVKPLDRTLFVVCINPSLLFIDEHEKAPEFEIVATLTLDVSFIVNPLDCRFPVVCINPDVASIDVHVRSPIDKSLTVVGVPLTLLIKVLLVLL
jgi:hypothetical protein